LASVLMIERCNEAQAAVYCRSTRLVSATSLIIKRQVKISLQRAFVHSFIHWLFVGVQRHQSFHSNAFRWTQTAMLPRAGARWSAHCVTDAVQVCAMFLCAIHSWVRFHLWPCRLSVQTRRQF